MHFRYLSLWISLFFISTSKNEVIFRNWRNILLQIYISFYIITLCEILKMKRLNNSYEISLRFFFIYNIILFVWPRKQSKNVFSTLFFKQILNWNPPNFEFGFIFLKWLIIFESYLAAGATFNITNIMHERKSSIIHTFT